MTNTTSGSGLAQTSLTRVVIGGWFQATIGLQFFPQLLAWTSEACFNKSNTHVGVYGAKWIVRNVHLSQGGCAEEGGFANVWFSDETDAHTLHALS
jgi:hypothetical protein